MEKRLYEPVKYTFTQDEIRELGEALAREEQTAFELAEHKAATVAEFMASLKAVNGRVADLVKKINNGYELREVECMVMMETPRPGMKRVIRMDTTEPIRDEPMTVAEMQSSFGFQEPEAK